MAQALCTDRCEGGARCRLELLSAYMIPRPRFSLRLCSANITHCT